MSDKDAMYGVVTAVVPDCNGFDDEPYTGYLINHNWGFSPILACPIKFQTFTVGEVVRVVQCGQYGANGAANDPMFGWGVMKYGNTYPQVLEIASQGHKYSIIDNPRYKATVAMTWLCNKAGKKSRYYWPGVVTQKKASTLVVAPQFGDTSYEVPIDTDLVMADFAVGDYVLVYASSAETKCIGWWQMEQGTGAYILSTLYFTDTNHWHGRSGVLILQLQNLRHKSAKDVTVIFSNTPGALMSDLVGSTWHVGRMEPYEIQTHYINVVFRGNWPTESGYSVDVSISDTSPRTDYGGTFNLPFNISQVSFVFDWGVFAPCAVHSGNYALTGYIDLLHRDTGGGVWKTFAVAYQQYAYPEPIGIFFELELDDYYGFGYGTSYVLSQGDGYDFKVVFEVSVNYTSPHKFAVFDIYVGNILVVSGFELLDVPPSAY